MTRGNLLRAVLAGGACALALAGAAAAQTRTFDIPAGDLKTALDVYARQTGVQLIYRADDIRGIKTVGVHGAVEQAAALNQILAHTGFGIRRDASGAFALVPSSPTATAPPAKDASAVEELIVTGRVGTEPQKRIDASYAISVVSEEQMRLQAPVSLADSLKMVPGIWVEEEAGEASANVRVRGIPSNGYSSIATYEDGLPVQNDGGLDWFNTDESFRIDETIKRFEVVRGGPSSIFASYAPGGVINFITRQGSDHFEALAKVQAGDYGYGRGDFWVGGPVAGFRVGLGGFYRLDHGIRDPGYNGDNGGQFRVSIDRDFEHGSIDFNFKHMDDDALFILGVPLTSDSKGNPKAAPGFNPSFDNLTGPEETHLTLRTNVGPYNFDLTKGTAVKLNQYTLNFKFDLGDGWQVTDGVRYRTSAMKRRGLFPNSPFIASSDAANQFLASLPASLGAVSARYVYVNHPGQAFDETNQNGTGLVMSTSAREQDATLDELIDDLRVMKKFEVGGQSHDVAVGLYFASADETFLQRGAQLLVDLRPHAQLLDIEALNGAGQVVQHLTENGFVRYGSQFEHGLGRSNSYALYASDAWQINEKLRIDLGARAERITMNGQAEQDAVINLGQSPTPADDNADMGTGVFTPMDHKFSGWSATGAINYQFTQHLGAFARFTKGLSLPSLGSFITDPFNEDPRVAGIQLYEAGLKAQGARYEFYATAFYSAFDSVPFGETVFDVKTNGFISRTSFTDTRTPGVELEGTIQPVDWFDLSLNATFEDPRFGSFKFTDDDGPHDFSNKLQTRTPTVMFRAIPGVNLLDDKLRAQLNFEYYGKRWADAANTQALPAYALVNAEVRYNLSDKITLYGYATNLFNSIGLIQGNPRAGQIISGDVGNKYFLASPELGRSLRVALLYRY